MNGSRTNVITTRDHYAPSEMADIKVEELKVGDEIMYTGSGFAHKFLTGKISAIYRDRQGQRVFDMGGNTMLVPSRQVLLPDWYQVPLTPPPA